MTEKNDKPDKDEDRGKEKEEEKQSSPGELPPAESPHIVHTLAMQALFYLGGIPDVDGKRAEVDLELAKFNIDLLEILKEKTRGNLTPEEDKLIDELLHVTRLGYIEVSKATQK